MIAKLTGILDSVSSDGLIINVGGVGYHAFASSRTLARIGQAGDPVSLLIDTHVREDHIHLYGFADAAEQEWCRILTGVQGVGMRVALAILGACPPEKLALSIAAQDTALLRQADGVGPKLATRIVTELKDKAGKMAFSAPVTAPKKSTTKSEPNDVPDIDHDAVSALINLGYPRADAYSAVLQVKGKSNDNHALPDLIRLALKELAS
jgi:Holliday junction DNA helicase RuvA